MSIITIINSINTPITKQKKILPTLNSTNRKTNNSKITQGFINAPIAAIKELSPLCMKCLALTYFAPIVFLRF
jgi:hypothetical protein